MKVSVYRHGLVREAEEAGILAGHLGIHNDALLSADSDMGTYDEPEMRRKKNWTGPGSGFLGK